MDITLEQSLASAVRYIQDNAAERTKIYFDEIPENFYVPSVYFQPPYTSGKKATLSSWRITMAMDIWFMERTDWDAHAKALEMQGDIMLDNCLLPVIDSSGEKTGKSLRVTPPETRRIDEGIVQMSMSFDVYFRPERQETKAEKIYFAWQNAKMQTSEEA